MWVESAVAPRFRLRFDPLVEGERVIEVPCDAAGNVDLAALDDALRNDYFYARLMRRLRLTEPVVIEAS
jgi:hypothetical protein